MTNPHRATVRALLKLCDLTVVASAFLLAVCAASFPGHDCLSVLEVRIKLHNFLFVAAYLGYCHSVLQALGLYRSYRLSPSVAEWRDLALAAFAFALPIAVLSTPLRLAFATAEFFAAFVAFAFVGLAIERRLLRTLARTMRRHGRNLRNVIIVGNGDSALDTAARLARRADLGYHVIDVIRTEVQERISGNVPSNEEVLDRIAAAIASQPIDEVFIALPLDTGQPLLRPIISLCEEQGITVRVLSSIVDPMLARAQIDEVDGRPVISIYTGPPDSLALAIKRMIDLGVSVVSLVLFAPLLLVIALVIKLHSPGPVFFVQERIGFNGRRFRAYKFRTMFEDAEQQQDTLEPLNEAQGPVFKIRNDPRVTRVGRWLRRFSIDEIPQLINVVRGEMSLVGPRPLPIRDVSRIEARAHKRRFSLRPGITCLWQVNGREPRFDEWIKADMEYLDNWSLALDLKILMKTIPAALSGRGAY